MKFFEEEVIVISKKFKNENDILVCFMSRSRGVFWAVAKNGRKSKRRFVNTFEQPSILNGLFRVSSVYNSRIIVEKVEILEDFDSIKSDLVKILSSWYILSLSKDLSVFGESYDFLVETLYKIQRLKSYSEIFKTVLIYSKELIKSEGFRYEEIYDNGDIYKLKKNIEKTITEIYGGVPKFFFVLDEISSCIKD